MAAPIPVVIAGGASGGWHVDRIDPVRGPSLAPVARVAVLEGTAVNGNAADGNAPALRGGASAGDNTAWILRGTTGHVRYLEQSEKVALASIQPGLGRPEATRAALIPIRKADAWWELAQDERRAVLEQRSHHIAVGMRYLPAIARRLYHSRELGQPFDFLTWFEYAPEHASAFEELVAALRESDEWNYVEREVDVRLSRPA